MMEEMHEVPGKSPFGSPLFNKEIKARFQQSHSEGSRTIIGPSGKGYNVTAQTQSFISQLLNKLNITWKGLNTQFEKFEEKDVGLKREIEGMNESLQAIHTAIKELKDEIKTRLEPFQKDKNALKAKLEEAIRSPNENQSDIIIEDLKNNLKTLKQKKNRDQELKTDIARLTILRNEWSSINANIKELKNEIVKGTRFQNSSVIRKLTNTQKAIQASFNDFVDQIPGHEAYKAQRIGERIASMNVDRITLDMMGLEIRDFTEEEETHIKKDLNKLMDMRDKGNEEIKSQINNILDKLKENHPELIAMMEKIKVKRTIDEHYSHSFMD